MEPFNAEGKSNLKHPVWKAFRAFMWHTHKHVTYNVNCFIFLFVQVRWMQRETFHLNNFLEKRVASNCNIENNQMTFNGCQIFSVTWDKIKYISQMCSYHPWTWNLCSSCYYWFWRYCAVCHPYNVLIRSRTRPRWQVLLAPQGALSGLIHLVWMSEIDRYTTCPGDTIQKLSYVVLFSFIKGSPDSRESLPEYNFFRERLWKDMTLRCASKYHTAEDKNCNQNIYVKNLCRPVISLNIFKYIYIFKCIQRILYRPLVLMSCLK